MIPVFLSLCVDVYKYNFYYLLQNLLHRKHFKEGSHHPHMHPTVATELAHDVATFLSSSETS